jgi:hypothetical protein
MTTRKDIVRELVDLMKEMKLNAPSKLYKHEAQRLLLAMKTMKKAHDDLKPVTRARPGPFGPRPIPVETVGDIQVPKALPKYVSERTKPVERNEITYVENVIMSFT